MSENRFDVAESVDELLGMMVGCGSMCWETLSGAGEFDSQEALKVVAEGKERLEQLRIAKDVERQAYHRGALEALTHVQTRLIDSKPDPQSCCEVPPQPPICHCLSHWHPHRKGSSCKS